MLKGVEGTIAIKTIKKQTGILILIFIYQAYKTEHLIQFLYMIQQPDYNSFFLFLDTSFNYC